MTKIPDLKG